MLLGAATPHRGFSLSLSLYTLRNFGFAYILDAFCTHFRCILDIHVRVFLRLFTILCPISVHTQIVQENPKLYQNQKITLESFV